MKPAWTGGPAGTGETGPPTGWAGLPCPQRPRGKTDAPAIGLIAHMDTSDAVPGATKPRVVPAYEGGVIRLENGVEISGFDFLESLKGQDLIVTSGDSVLGADDKAGVAEIMALCERMLAPDAPDHGKICIAFTPDEEIGRGTDHFDIPRFGEGFAYTVDGGALGELEYECFNAASCIVRVKGVSIHPGSAKDQMINASLVAMEFAAMLPPWQRPEHILPPDRYVRRRGSRGASIHPPGSRQRKAGSQKGDDDRRL